MHIQPTFGSQTVLALEGPASEAMPFSSTRLCLLQWTVFYKHTEHFLFCFRRTKGSVRRVRAQQVFFWKQWRRAHRCHVRTEQTKTGSSLSPYFKQKCMYTVTVNLMRLHSNTGRIVQTGLHCFQTKKETVTLASHPHVLSGMVWPKFKLQRWSVWDF